MTDKLTYPETVGTTPPGKICSDCGLWVPKKNIHVCGRPRMTTKQKCSNCKYYKRMARRTGKCAYHSFFVIDTRKNTGIIVNRTSNSYLWCEQWYPVDGNLERELPEGMEGAIDD